MLFHLASRVSQWAVPLLLLFIPLIGMIRGVKVYEIFVEGAAEGMKTAVRIMPFLVAMMVAVSIFRVSGAMDLCSSLMKPILQLIGIPAELVPLAVMRPLSGSAALGITSEILNTLGPDSFAGRVASTVLGSTDTTFYILTVYFGSVGIRKARYAVFVGMVGDLVGFFASVVICRLLFGQ